MISIIRYVSGYVEFCAEGGFSERFLNLCKLNGISLWNVENDGVKVNACTSAGEFQRIETPAKKSGMTVKVLANKGLPFWARRHKWRCGVLLGLLLAVCIVWYMSGFIWEVEIVDEPGVKINNFTKTLDDLGVRPGARKSKIDIRAVQEELLEMYPELSWVSLNIFGDKAQIEYTPSSPAPQIIDTKTPSNIVASKSGKITLIEGYSGTNAVKEGAFVSEGSLLISGVKSNADGTEKLVRARGKVFAQTENTFVAAIKEKGVCKISAEITRRYRLDLFGFSLPLGFKPVGGLSSVTEIPLKVNSVILPVGITREECVNFTEADIGYNEKEAYLLNLLLCVEEKRKKYENADIKKLTFNRAEENAGQKLTMVVVCVEDIGFEKEVFVEEN